MAQERSLSIVERLGLAVLSVVYECGHFGIFSVRMLGWVFRSFTRWKLLGPQLYEIGVCSLPVIFATGAFVGMVLAVQVFFQMRDLGAKAYTGLLINLSVVKELGPVLAGVMLAGRVGGALAAELGTMKVTEQIDALESLAADPIRYLVVPRFLACLLLIPFLTVYCDFVGVLGGYAVVVGVYGGTSYDYWYHSAQGIETFDVMAGVLKSVFFGGAIALISCYKGFHSRQGAEGVGRATTEAFVLSFMAILCINLVMAVFFKAFYSVLWGVKPSSL